MLKVYRSDLDKDAWYVEQSPVEAELVAPISQWNSSTMGANVYKTSRLGGFLTTPLESSYVGEHIGYLDVDGRVFLATGVAS